MESKRHIPFDIQRIYYLYDVPAHQLRGAHAHRDLQQVVISLAGGFDVVLEGVCGRSVFRLDRPDTGLYLGPMVWRELLHFTPGAVCLVLASLPYDDSDYFHDYEEFMRALDGWP